MKKLIIFFFMSAMALPAQAAEKKAKCGNGAVKVVTGTSNATYIDTENTETYNVYRGSQNIVDIASCRGGVVTAFSGKGIYYSPDCFSIGGRGNTENIYTGTQGVRSMKSAGTEVIIRFDLSVIRTFGTDYCVN
jgi:hypothetical protein